MMATLFLFFLDQIIVKWKFMKHLLKQAIFIKTSLRKVYIESDKIKMSANGMS